MLLLIFGAIFCYNSLLCFLLFCLTLMVESMLCTRECKHGTWLLCTLQMSPRSSGRKTGRSSIPEQQSLGWRDACMRWSWQTRRTNWRPKQKSRPCSIDSKGIRNWLVSDEFLCLWTLIFDWPLALCTMSVLLFAYFPFYLHIIQTAASQSSSRGWS